MFHVKNYTPSRIGRGITMIVAVALLARVLI